MDGLVQMMFLFHGGPYSQVRAVNFLGVYPQIQWATSSPKGRGDGEWFGDLPGVGVSGRMPWQSGWLIDGDLQVHSGRLRMEPANHPWKERKMIWTKPAWICSMLIFSGVIHVHTCLDMSKDKLAELKLECHQQYDPNERSQRIVGKGRVRYLITHTTFIFVMDSLFVMSISGCWPSSWTHGHGFVGLSCQTKFFDLQEIQFPTVIMLNNYVGHLSSRFLTYWKAGLLKLHCGNTWHKRPISGSE